jgi:hypothetical protein
MNGRAKPRLRVATKLGFAGLTWFEYFRLVVRIRRTSLPDLVHSLESSPYRVSLPPLEPRRLGRLVSRVLDRGPFHPRCLTLSLVYFRMLARQGTEAHLVVGLPESPTHHDAHAWVEVAGEVVGPPPGRLGHEEMVRYGGTVRRP